MRTVKSLNKSSYQYWLIATLAMTLFGAWLPIAQAGTTRDISATPNAITVSVGQTGTSNLKATRPDDPRTAAEKKDQPKKPTYIWSIIDKDGADLPAPNGPTVAGSGRSAILTAGRTTAGTSHVKVQVVARWSINGGGHLDSSPERVKVPVTGIKVSLTPVKMYPSTDNWPLDRGVLCLNAQSNYKNAKWRVTVLPTGTTATATSSDVKVINGSGLKDRDTFTVQGKSNESPGKYTLTITSEQASSVTNTSKGTAFKFVSVFNTTSLPTARKSGGGLVANNAVGGPHNGGVDFLEWTSKDTDSTYYTSAGLGDKSKDVQADLDGFAQNHYDNPSTRKREFGVNGTEFYAAASEMGTYETGTVPKNIFSGRVRYELKPTLTAEADYQGWTADRPTWNLSLGGSMFGVVSFGVTVANVDPGGTFAFAGDVGLKFKGTSRDDPFNDGGWHAAPVEQMRRNTKKFTINDVTYSDEGTIPLKTPLGFSGGFSMREDAFTKTELGIIKFGDYKLTIPKPKYEIIK